MTDVCEHVQALRAWLRKHGISIRSEHGEEPDGWVNVTCSTCATTQEITLIGEQADRENDRDY